VTGTVLYGVLGPVFGRSAPGVDFESSEVLPHLPRLKAWARRESAESFLGEDFPVAPILKWQGLALGIHAPIH
jgi:hypothetical protein